MITVGHLLGRVFSQKNRLLTAADWQKFQSAEGLADWLSRLQSTDYAAAVEHAGTYAEFEKYLHQTLAALRQDLFDKKDTIAEIFWQKYDWHNLKILLKEKLTEQNLDKYLLPLGKNTLSAFEPRLIEQAIEIYTQTTDFCQMDYFLDQEYFAWLKKASKRLGAEVKAYVRAQIDIANFKLWGKDFPCFPGGDVSLDLFAQDTPEETLRKCFPEIDLPREFNDGIVEKVLDDYANKLLCQGHYSDSRTAIFRFLQAKENEVKNLKTMYLSQSRALPAMQTYLRYSYV